MSILIADSGSTKTDWIVAQQGKLIQRIFTKGINPYYQAEEEISKEIETDLLPKLQPGESPIEKVWFYGAGCAYARKIEIVRRALERQLKAPAEVNSDLWGAARGLCGHEAGIACILGTGSNSCFYDGEKITQTVSPLGFILGDEGSGAALGKQLVNNCLKNQLPEEIGKKFLEQFSLTPEIIMDRVYKQPFPNRFLAGLSSFIAQHLNVSALRNMVSAEFKQFFTRNVMQYEYAKYPVHFVGSVAYLYRSVLEEVAQELNIQLGNIVQSPAEGLVRYHQ